MIVRSQGEVCLASEKTAQLCYTVAVRVSTSSEGHSCCSSASSNWYCHIFRVQQSYLEFSSPNNMCDVISHDFNL